MFGLLFQYNDSSSILPAVGIATVAGGILLLYLQHSRGRADAMRKLADRRGLTWLCNTPRDFPRKLLDDQYCGWLIPRWSNAHNIIGGDIGDDSLLAFDINVLKGEKIYRRTIVARRSATATAKLAVAKGYIYRSCGEWHMVTLESSPYTITRLIEPATIERLWELLR